MSFNFLLIYKDNISMLVYYTLRIIEKSLIFIFFKYFLFCLLWIYLVTINAICLFFCSLNITFYIRIESPYLFFILFYCSWVLIGIYWIKLGYFFIFLILFGRNSLVARKYSFISIRNHLQSIIFKFHRTRRNILLTFYHFSKNSCYIPNMLKCNTT